MSHRVEREIAGRPLILETGKLAGQANGAVTVRQGDTILLVTAVAGSPREGIDFFPLTIDFEERLYAVGRIPGSFFRREGRPTQEAILTMRLTDRPLRPLFPKGMRSDLQVIITTLSADQEHDPQHLAIIGASAALSISDIPFGGPISATRIGFIDGKLVANPTFQEQQESALDLMVAGTREAVVMVEAGANEVSEEIVIQGMKLAQIVNGETIDLQEELMRSAAKPKFAVTLPEPAPQELADAVAEAAGDRLDSVLFKPGRKAERDADVAEVKKSVVAGLSDRFDPSEVGKQFEAHLKSQVRKSVVGRGVRLDGRGLDEIRPITCEVGVLPRTHGSGLFTRGETQALSIATLGSLSLKQRLDTIGIEDKKRYMHHYNMPPYSTGEAKRIGSSGRREIGHGALAERALLPMLPDEDEFPYALRVVSEILSSNGSTSMASVCGSTLSLMDAGVPIKKPVAGIAMGLVIGDTPDQFSVLTDILGWEDALGDMDFKVAGTKDGITALQMDLKSTGITFPVIAQALEQAKAARMHILGKMAEAITEARPELSQYAPRMLRIKIDPEKIGAVIGPGGKMIRSIQDQTGASVDIEDDGTVIIGSSSESGAKKAIEMIEGLTKEVEVGEVYTGKVVRTMNFGAFVEILPGKDGMVHISELADFRVNTVDEVVKIGDEVTVMVIEIDRMGRINLSRRAVLEGPEAGGARVRDGAGGGDRGGDRDRDRGGDRGGGDRGGDRDRGPRPYGDRSGGPPRGGSGPPRGGSGGPPRAGNGRGPRPPMRDRDRGPRPQGQR